MNARGPAPTHLAFLLIPKFSLMAFAAAIEPLRVANRLAGTPLYQWQLCSLDGQPVVASNGIPIGVDCGLDRVKSPDLLIVCVGLDPQQNRRNWRLRNQLRLLARQGCRIGGISGASFMLADAGLLDRRRCTVHWEYADLFAQLYPRVEMLHELYVIDRDVFTCAGGTAALDMMLQFVSERGGPKLAVDVAEQFLHPRIRDHGDHQRTGIKLRYRLSSPTLAEIIELMEATALADPLALRDIADRTGISQRQMERLFRRELGVSPRSFYMKLRLARGRDLLVHTLRPIREVALECRFESTSHFSRSYKRIFGVTPRDERVNARIETDIPFVGNSSAGTTSAPRSLQALVSSESQRPA